MKKIVSIAIALGLGIMMMTGCGSGQASQEKESRSDASASSEVSAVSAGAEAADNQYVIKVQDAETGEPIKDVKVQFCDDTECRMGQTDENGSASFESEPGEYTAHVLKAPEGYEKSDEEIKLTADEKEAVFELAKSGDASAKA